MREGSLRNRKKERKIGHGDDQGNEERHICHKKSFFSRSRIAKKRSCIRANRISELVQRHSDVIADFEMSLGYIQ
jgi:hypothetical protein